MVRRLSGGICIRKQKTLVCWLLRIAEDKLLCFSQLSRKKWLMFHVDFLMIATIVERCDLWQSCELTLMNLKERYIRKIDSYRNRTDLYCKILNCWTTSQVLRRPNVKTPWTGQFKESRWQWFGPPEGCASNGKVILTVCLYACASTCVRLRACVAACLLLCHPGGGGGRLFYFYKLIRVPPSPGVGQCLCLSIFLSTLTFMSWSATNLLSSLFKIWFVSTYYIA